MSKGGGMMGKMSGGKGGGEKGGSGAGKGEGKGSDRAVPGTSYHDARVAINEHKGGAKGGQSRQVKK